MKRLLLPLLIFSLYIPAFPQQAWVDSVFNSLSEDQRIAQLMVVRLSERTSGGIKFYDRQVENYIKKYNIGAICLFQGGPVKQAQLLNRFQSIAQTPVMICIDGETGLGMRITDSIAKFPDQLTLGAMQDAGGVYKVGRAIADQCRRMGIHVNYAPVVDVNNNPDNPVINFRSFGENKYKVALFGT
ncbi:MAG TPA: glycoside hydrolase family 3 N-terminal domain-containing protein, partial [Chitinophagaceae bacterium]|nr:glycoside hydrolase family 3 N-terminal domain-containing protein [Chitinophagaceae bacterium]